MTEKALLWNRFIEEICYQDMENLSEIQRIAVLCFWYDAEMNSGGYSGYMDCYPDTDPIELEPSLCDYLQAYVEKNKTTIFN